MTRLFRAIWLVLTLRCEEADRLRSVRAMRDLTRSERLAERVHAGLCKSCRHARKQLDALDHALQDLRETSDAEPVPMPAETRERLERALRKRSDDRP